MMNIYFNAVSISQFDVFSKEFDEEQYFITASFGIFYSLDYFRLAGFTLVNVFYGFLGNSDIGWVSPILMQLDSLRFPDPKILSKANSFVRKHNDVLTNQSGVYSRYLRTVSEMFANAEKNILSKNMNQAFIDLFVGLDFFLAPDTEKSRKLKRRIAFGS